MKKNTLEYSFVKCVKIFSFGMLAKQRKQASFPTRQLATVFQIKKMENITWTINAFQNNVATKKKQERYAWKWCITRFFFTDGLFNPLFY